MKKFLALMLVTVMIICCTACGGKNEITKTEGNTSPGVDYSEPVINVNEGKDKTEKYEGVTITCNAYNKDLVDQMFNITLPTDPGRDILYGFGSAAHDGTWILGGYIFNFVDIVCDSVENIYEAYQTCWEEAIADMRHDLDYSDFKFNVESREMKEINGFSMCRYVGTHTYKLEHWETGEITDYACYFVAYGTQLSNGAYIYWIVFDESADQSLKDVVISNADNMAKSLEETELI